MKFFYLASMNISKRWTMPIRNWKPALNRLVSSFKVSKNELGRCFTSLIISWLCGLWRMLLGIPIIFVIKVICEHIKHLQPVAESLSD